MNREAPSVTPGERTAVLSQLIEDHGFAAWGVCDAAPTDYADELRAWLAEDKHGEMGYLAEQLGERLDPQLVKDGAVSCVMVADRYASSASEEAPRPGVGRIARYARGRDYHRVIKKRLHTLADAMRALWPGADFRSFVDTAPVLEREFASRAGLGWIGKHSLLIHPVQGSYLLLGGMLSTVEFAPRRENGPVADHCGTCTRCIDACPTRAITPYSVDARRCISYLTIEHRSAIDPSFHEPMSDWLAGCDVCQDVCPHNRAGRAVPGDTRSEYAERQPGFDLLGVLGWAEADRRAAFESSALKRISLEVFRRNAIIAAGNSLERSDDAEIRAKLVSIAGSSSEPELTRSAAKAVLARLDQGVSEGDFDATFGPDTSSI